MLSLSTESYPYRDLHPRIRTPGGRLRPAAHVLGHRPHAHAMHATTSASRSSPSICRGCRARISEWVMGRAASGSAGPCRRRDRHEIYLVQPDAVAVPARRLPREAPLGVGRHPEHALRPAEGPPRLPHVSWTSSSTPRRSASTASACNEHHQNGYGLMPSPNLIAATLARRTSRAAHLRDRQLDRRLQPADPRRRRVRDARRASPAGGSSPASRSARRWTPTSATARSPRSPATSTARRTT